MVSLAAVILAGGRSSRMGRDKALMSLGGEVLIQRTCRVAMACADAVYIVTPWGDRYQALLPATVTLIEERAATPLGEVSPGPLVALVQALGVLAELEHRPDWVLALACDLPNLSAATLAAWRGELTQVEAHQLAYLPQRQGRWEPLCGFYRVAALEDLRRYVALGGKSFQPWLNQRPVAAIPSADERMLVNVNTPTDWAAWQTAIDMDSER